jgi:hypothetical protein
VTDPYWWVRQSPIIMVTAVRGRSAAECLAAWGEAVEEPEWMDFDEALNLASRSYYDRGPTWTIVDDVGDGVVVWDTYGDDGLRAPVLCGLTEGGGRALTVASYPKMRAQFLYAEDGALVAEFSSLAGGGVTGADPDRVRSAMAEAGLDPDHPNAEACLRLAPPLLGIEIFYPDPDREVLAAPHVP